MVVGFLSRRQRSGGLLAYPSTVRALTAARAAVAFSALPSLARLPALGVGPPKPRSPTPPGTAGNRSRCGCVVAGSSRILAHTPKGERR